MMEDATEPRSEREQAVDAMSNMIAMVACQAAATAVVATFAKLSATQITAVNTAPIDGRLHQHVYQRARAIIEPRTSDDDVNISPVQFEAFTMSLASEAVALALEAGPKVSR